MHTHTRARKHTSTQAHTHALAHKHTSTRAHEHTSTHRHTRTHTHTHTHTHTRTRTHTHTHQASKYLAHKKVLDADDIAAIREEKDKEIVDWMMKKEMDLLFRCALLLL